MSNRKSSVVSWLVVALGAVGGLWLASCSTMTRDVTLASIEPATIPGAEYIGSDSCAMCHPGESRGFEGEPHAAFKATKGDAKVGEGCEACHGPGSLHVQAQDGSKILKGNYKRCFSCHLDKKHKFNLQYHHPVEEGHVSCTDCHDPHSSQQPVQRAQKINDTCFECHPDIEGPWTFPHQAVEEDGCTVCHDPHGANLDKMLVADSPNLCLRCHFQVHGEGEIGDRDHSGAPLHAITSGCTNCHQAVHGSNFSVHLRHP